MFLSANLFIHRKSKIFRFDNYWTEYNACYVFFAKAWNCTHTSSPTHTFSNCVSITKHNLISRRTYDVSPLEVDIHNTELTFTILKCLRFLLAQTLLSIGSCILCKIDAQLCSGRAPEMDSEG